MRHRIRHAGTADRTDAAVITLPESLEMMILVSEYLQNFIVIKKNVTADYLAAFFISFKGIKRLF